jgi:hypothetical protein
VNSLVEDLPSVLCEMLRKAWSLCFALTLIDRDIYNIAVDKIAITLVMTMFEWWALPTLQLLLEFLRADKYLSQTLMALDSYSV